MSISYIYTILEDLKTQMKEKITPGTFYDTSPTIKRGITTWQDTEELRPFIWFISDSIEYEETLSTTTIVAINIELVGYADTDGYGNNDNMFKLLKDVEYFLLNDYKDADGNNMQVSLVDCVIEEGGINEEVGQAAFSINIRVLTEFNSGTIL